MKPYVMDYLRQTILNKKYYIRVGWRHTHTFARLADLQRWSLPLNHWWLSYLVCLHFKILWILSVYWNFEFIISARTRKKIRGPRIPLTRILHLTLTWSKRDLCMVKAFSGENYNCDVRLFHVRSCTNCEYPLLKY